MIRGGRERHHLVDPRTGDSADSPLVSVTVVADEGWWAETSAKAIFVAGTPAPRVTLPGVHVATVDTRESSNTARTPGGVRVSPHLAWYVAASGILAWLLLSASVIWGLLLSTHLLQRRPSPRWLLDLHRFLGGLAVTFVGVHVLGLVADNYIHFGVADVLVPPPWAKKNKKKERNFFFFFFFFFFL